MATSDPREKAQRAREERFDRFLDVAEAILDEDAVDELGDEPGLDDDDDEYIELVDDEDE